MRIRGRVAGVLAALAAAATTYAADPGETTLVYRLRGEVRPLLFWVGRNDVGGGRITIRRSYSSPVRWRDEIEVLFGSDPERVPRRINRWGYGRESADWVRDSNTAAPRLLATTFDGLMRHSTESSIAEVAPDAGAYTFEVTRSVASEDRAWHQRWTFTDSEDFTFRRPERLLAKYRAHVTMARPLHAEDLSRRSYSQPYGFLTALMNVVMQVVETQRAPAPLTFVYNAKPYVLEVKRVRRVRCGSPPADVAAIEFRTFNTVRKTRTEFALWTPLSGDLKGMPLRIVLQPRWWLRLQMDLDRSAPAGSERQ